jgi:hypothetical protein
MLLDPRLMWSCSINVFSSSYLHIESRAHYESPKAIDELRAGISQREREMKTQTPLTKHPKKYRSGGNVHVRRLMRSVSRMVHE